MAYHKRWTNADLVGKMLRIKYRGYKELVTWMNVLYKDEFYSVSLVQNGEDRKAVFSQRKNDSHSWWFETVKVITFSSKEEGNRFYKQVEATERISKHNTRYYTIEG